MRLHSAAALISAAVVFSLTMSCGESDPPGDDGGTVCSPVCGVNAVCNAGTCECVPFSAGDPLTMCSADCSATGCANGNCAPGPSAAVCVCEVGWTGPACDEPVNGCLTGTSARCVNGGVCVSTGPNSYACDCPLGFTGTSCETTAMGCPARPCVGGSCTVENGGNYTCVCERGFSGTDCDVGVTECTPEPCANGGTCADPTTEAGNEYTCSGCGTGFVGASCEVTEVASSCGAYVDVVYRIAGSFRVANTPLNLGNVTKDIGTNAAEPDFAHAGVTSPFPPTVFANGFVRLRFHNTGVTATPGAGRVEVIEWYVPIEFDVEGASIPTVRTNVDHSAGIVGLANRYADFQQTLERACRPVASGVLAGTTLDWDTCAVTPTGTPTFKTDVAQANVNMDDGCLRRLSSSGNTRCIEGSCGLVPSVSVGDQRSTWDQPLPNFVFSGTNYATATFTMPEVQLANDTGTTTWLTITSATPSHTECADVPTCDEVCDADSCDTPP